MTSKDVTKFADYCNVSPAAHAAAIHLLGKQTVANFIEIGGRLVACKAKIGTRNWACWLDRELGWSERAGDKFMALYELSKSKNANFAEIDLPVSAFYLLAAPGTPTTTRDEILERAEAGEKLDLKTVKAEIAAAKPPRSKRKRSGTSSKPPESLPATEPAPVDPPVVAEPAPVDLRSENAGLKHEINRLKGAHEDEIKHLQDQNVAARPQNLQAAIQQLIEEANRTTCFENVLPEDVVYAAKDLDRVISHLGKLDKFMAKRRKAMKSKKSPPVAPPVDDGIPADLRRLPAKSDLELTPDEVKSVIAAINRENNDVSWRVDADGSGGALKVCLNDDGSADGKPEKVNLIELAHDFEIDIDRIRKRAGASTRIITQSVH